MGEQIRTGIQGLRFTGTLPLSMRNAKCIYVEKWICQSPFNRSNVFTDPRDCTGCTGRAPDPRIECANLHGLTLF